MRLALAQLDSRLGDLESNWERARQALAEARAVDADLIVFPELQLSGYALGHSDRDAACTADALAQLAAEAGEGSCLLCFRERSDDARTHNSAAYFERGRLVHVHRKLYLPHYLDFEEAALFAPGDEMRIFDTAFGPTAVLICNDAWQPCVPALAVADGASVLLVAACSATAVAEAERYWREITRFYARMLACYVVFVNRVGRERGFTFWGGSHVVDPRGELVAQAPRLAPSLTVADLDLAAVERRREALALPTPMPVELLRAELPRRARRPA